MCFGALRSFHQFKRTESNKHEKPCRKVVITVKIGTLVMKTDIVQMTSGRKVNGIGVICHQAVLQYNQ